MTISLKPLAALALGLVCAGHACAQDSGKRHEVWLGTGFATYHFQGELDLNGRNPGIGVEYRFADSAAVTAGRFYNSDRQHTRYVGVLYQPWSLGPVKLGAVLAAFDGYPKMRDGGWFLAPVPAASFEYKKVGVNVAVVPTYKNRLHGGISVQLKFKLWE
ncbi:MAG: hypothetical protein H7176_03290 [Bdellovibrionales bacterium]|nr:hypothetical protein [Massilia sp.]